MSSNLTWEPSERKRGDFTTAVKFALQKRFGGSANCTLDQSMIPYVQGLIDGGVEGAQEVLDAIEKYESIDLTEVY